MVSGGSNVILLICILASFWIEAVVGTESVISDALMLTRLENQQVLTACGGVACALLLASSSSRRWVVPVAFVALGVAARDSLARCGWPFTLGSLLVQLFTRTFDLPQLMNPFDISWGVWLGVLPLHFISKLLLDWIIEKTTVFVLRAKLLGSRDPKNPGSRGLQALSTIDFIFLCINAVIEYVFTFQIIMLAYTSPLITWGQDQLTILNTLAALPLIFIVDDLLYAPMHRFMHWRPVYWMIHKHHHKQAFPIRGYFDAANESPIEQVLGLSCVWITLHIVPAITGLHVYTLFVFFVLYAATAMLNHTAYDVKGLGYSSGAHEMHHRLPNCNYGQNFMVWDMLMGTYRPYQN